MSSSIMSQAVIEGGNSTNAVNCSIMCINLMDTSNSWPLWIYVGLNAFLLVVGIRQLIHTIIKKGYFADSTSNISVLLWVIRFLISCQLVPIFVRIITNSFSFSWKFRDLISWEYTVPHLCQFVIFLCIVFYIFDIYLQSWEERSLGARNRRRRMVFGLMVACVLVVTSLDITQIYYASKHRHDEMRFYDHGTTEVMAPLYFVISIFLGIASFFFYKKLPTFQRDTTENERRVERIFFNISVVFTITFFAHACWSITYYCNVNEIELYVGKLLKSPNFIPYHVAWLVFYGFFEIIPAAILFWYIREIGNLRTTNNDDYTTIHFDRRTIGSKWPYKQVHGEDQPVSSVSRQDSHETKPLAPFRNYTANTFSTTV
eukprot:m.51836 g.51836  ORF g.51836 m.51836 type:complete len:373 (-) comp7586_c0_seq5:405-1523(-)